MATCEKDYSLTVVDPNLLAYYNCESFAPVPPPGVQSIMQDQTVGGRDLEFQNEVSYMTALVPGKIDNGWKSLQALPLVDDPFFNFTNGFTVRLWIRLQPAFWNFLNPSLIVSQGVNDWWELEYFVEPMAPPRITLRLDVSWGGSGSSNTVVDTTITGNDGLWHRVVAWLDRTNNLIGIKADDNPSVTAGGIGAFTPDNAIQVMRGTVASGTNHVVEYDECGFWNGYIWTPTDFNTDWNGGAGIGWPESGEIGP